MPSRILSDRTHLDKKVLAGCPESQAIPFDKLHLAPRVGNKIFRPQKAAYMINNLGLNQADKETFLSDFVERSTKGRPILPPPVQYNMRSVDSNRPNISQAMYNELIASLNADVATARSETMRERVFRKFQTSRRDIQIQILTDYVDPAMDMNRTDARVQSFKAALPEMDEERLGELELSIDEVTLGGSPIGSTTSVSVSRLTSAAGSPIQE
jgi:hypothetical protein